MLGLALCAYAFLSIVWSDNRFIAFAGALRLAQALFVCALLIQYRMHRSLFAVCIVAAAVLQSLFGFLQFSMQQSPASSWLGLAYHAAHQLGDAVVEVGETRWLRAYGSLPHPNVLASFLSLGLFSCLYLMRTVRTKFHVWLLLGAWCAMVGGLFFAFSREVWIGTLVGLCVIALMGRRMKSGTEKISPFLMTAVVSGVLIASLSIMYWEPLSGRLGIGGASPLEQKSISERMQSYRDGLSLARRSPFVGVGMHQSVSALYNQDVKNNAIRPLYAYQPPHNLFILIFGELGIIGIVLFGALKIIFLAPSVRTAHMSVFLGAVAMVAIAGMFDHFFWTLQSGLFVWWIAFAFSYTPSFAPLDRKKNVL